jgi:hypothetical protein
VVLGCDFTSLAWQMLPAERSKAMFNQNIRWLLLLGFAAVSQFGMSAAAAETFTGSQTGFNIFVYLKVNEDAAQDLLSEGWTTAPWPKGAWKGANLMLIFNEAHAEFDAARKPVRDGGYLSNLVITWGRSQEVKWRIFIPYRFATDKLGPRSGVAPTMAAIRREMSRVSDGTQHPSGTERWTVEAQGGLLSFEMNFDARKPRFSKPSGRTANPDDPDGPSQIFRIEQLSYMIYGQNGIDTVDRVKLTNSIPELMPLLDGTEEILAIRILPVKMVDRFDP